MHISRIARAALFPLALLATMACSKVEEPTSSYKPADGKPLPPGPTQLEKIDSVVGTGKEAKSGDTVKVHYTGTLLDGTKFDSSLDRNEPFEFKLGSGGVIKGWDEGVVGMKVGGKRTLRIPYDKAYGEAGSPPKIPPKAALNFDIELVGVKIEMFPIEQFPSEIQPLLYVTAAVLLAVVGFVIWANSSKRPSWAVSEPEDATDKKPA